MLKKLLLALAAIAIVVIICEIVALIHEKASRRSFAAYWNRHNQSTTGSFTYVALGDSTAQGIGASSPANSYAAILAGRIAKQTGKKVRFINLSVSGAKIKDVLDGQLPELKQYKPDLVTIEIGANDLARYNPEQFRAEFYLLTERLPAGTFVSDMPYFGGRVHKNSEALAANEVIYKSLQGRNLQLVRLQSLTRQRQSIRNYAADFFHPSNRGYVNWADAFWMEIRPQLEAPASSRSAAYSAPAS